MKHGKRQQQGAALILAMLVVVLVATLSAAALWQRWRMVEVESAQRQHQQMQWVLTGAMDWARLILVEDAKKGGPDHLAEPWSIPLEQARLSTFLAADQSDALVADASSNVFLSGSMVDLQSKFNLRNLVQNNALDPTSYQQLRRLFIALKLPPAELDAVANGLIAAFNTTPVNNTPLIDRPLVPQNMEQAQWLGLSAHSMDMLRPYVTLLPGRTTLNLNTATKPVLLAAIAGAESTQIDRLLEQRRRKPWDTLAQAQAALGNPTYALEAERFGTQTAYFEVRGLITLDETQAVTVSVVERTGTQVRTLQRSFGH